MWSSMRNTPGPGHCVYVPVVTGKMAPLKGPLGLNFDIPATNTWISGEIDLNFKGDVKKLVGTES